LFLLYDVNRGYEQGDNGVKFLILTLRVYHF